MKYQRTQLGQIPRHAASGRSGASILPWSHAAVFLLLNISVGLETPVLSLMLLARGATLETLPLVVGVTLVATAICEVPSGIAADAWGRRRLFCWAMALQIAAHLVLLLPASIAVVAVSSALRGLALAARTGTLEVIEIDRVVARHVDSAGRCAALDALNGRLALLESVGCGLGALAGGLLATLDARYVLLIWCIVLASACALVGALLLYPPEERGQAAMHQSIAQVLADMRQVLAVSGDVRLVLVLSASAGVIMLAVETYWQLSFQQLAGAGSEWMLGPVNCLGMVAAAAGSTAAMRAGAALSQALGRGGRCRLYLLLHAAAALCLLVLGTAPGIGIFIAGYALYYVCIAARSVIEQTVLHNVVPSRERASMASIQSLALRGGGALASAAGAGVVAAFGISGTWPVFAALALLLELMAFRGKAGGRKKRTV